MDGKLNSLVIELGAMALIWVMWLGECGAVDLLRLIHGRSRELKGEICIIAAGIATTLSTEEGRGFCKNLDNLTNDPELAGLDPSVLGELPSFSTPGFILTGLLLSPPFSFKAAAKKILQSVCSELHAELAFIWISWILVTAAVGLLVFSGLKKQKRLGRSVSVSFYIILLRVSRQRKEPQSRS